MKSFTLILPCLSVLFAITSITSAAPVAVTEAEAAAGPLSGVKVTVLPLGDSITYGFRSSDGNGYRGRLHSGLEKTGAIVDFVGSQRHGTMQDNEHEGYPGATIDQILTRAVSHPQALPSHPQLVLVHAGTNNFGSKKNQTTAPQRLRFMLDTILDKDPGATVIYAQIIPSQSAARNDFIVDYNNKIKGYAAEYQKQGKKVSVVDMYSALDRSPGSPDFYSNGTIHDGLHPSDAGYVKMAKVWYYGIKAAHQAGWI